MGEADADPSHMHARRALATALVCVAAVALALAPAPSAWGRTAFHPRIGGALGLVPPAGSHDVASGAQTPVTYHGGSVMAGGITVHTIFWAPAGFRFDGSPRGGVPDYKSLIERFFLDASRASGAFSNVFSVLGQFAQGTKVGAVTPGAYSIGYDPATDSVADTNPYPAAGDQCASPGGVSTCITDAQVQAEVDRVVGSTPGTPRGLHNLWFVFLPPNVDECILPGSCGTNAFGGYHSLSNVAGHGVTIYALAIDPIIESTVGPGSDPQGNPDAEATVDVAAHETAEAMTDPEGVGWMDPNGFEVGDKCENGPQHGTPLGFGGPDNAPYNQVIDGDAYLLQEMWSNDDNGCVQQTALTVNPLPLPQVNLTQFSSTVTGNIGSNTAGVGVKVSLQRAAADGSIVNVATASATSAGDGGWSASLAPHAVGDDRDRIAVDYAGAGAPSPAHEVIRTGNGGDPFAQSGWTGWFDLDNGLAVTNDPRMGGPSLTLAPCFQTGVLGATAAGAPLPSPTDFCNTQTDAATVSTPAIGPATALSASSTDNRAFSDPNGPTPNGVGALVSLSVPAGEADALSQFASPLPAFSPTGFPSCNADLQAQAVTCTGLVQGRGYTLSDARTGARLARSADRTGTLMAHFPLGRLRGGDAVSLSNGSRTLTTLHVAHLKVAVTERQTVLSGGTCQPGQYYGPPLTAAPTNDSAGGPGVALTGEVCPLSGHAAGLSTAAIAQTDELSGGLTKTEVPYVQDTSPIQGETVYGPFTALAEAGLPGPNSSIVPPRGSTIALRIVHARGGRVAFRAANVETRGGVNVKGLSKGAYTATWMLTDASGDTRTVTTRFVEQAGAAGHSRRHGSRGPRPKVECELRHRGPMCVVEILEPVHGMMRLTVTTGGALTALGHARVRHGLATVVLRQLRPLQHGMWKVTLVLSQPHQAAVTSTVRVRV